MDVEWAEPPKSWMDRYVEFAAALRARPGRWAKWPRVYSTPTGGANVFSVRAGILKGRPAPFAEGRWDAKVRGGLLYVCYIGPGPVDTD